jgi:hypothetical protein
LTRGEGWKTFLNTRDDFQREIKYVGQNPRGIGCAEQRWDFVQPYDGWLPGFRG